MSKPNKQPPNILDMFDELNQSRALVAQQASQIIAQLQPLTVVDTAIGPMANGQHRLAAVMKRGGFRLPSVHARAATPAPVTKKRQKRAKITPAMRQMVLGLSKDPNNSANTIAKEVGISAPSVFNIRKVAKQARKAKTKKGKLPAAAVPAAAK